jgi:hypothetical protein
MRRTLRSLAVASALLLAPAALTVAHRALADGKTESEVKKLQSDAMDVDFLGLDLKNAKKKLKSALDKCGSSKCSDAVVAGLHRDLGIVLINDKNAKDGAAEFAAAFEADASVSIGKDFLGNAEVAKAWDAEKKKAGGGSKKPKKSGDDDDDDDAPKKKPKKSGDDDDDDAPKKKPKKPSVSPDSEGNLHIATKSAPVGYVLPIVVDMPDGLDVDSVKISYKTPSMEKFKAQKAIKSGGKFYVKVDCIDTQFVADMKVYARAYDADGNEVDHFGTLKSPYIIKLVDKLPDTEEAPAYPDGKEADKCTDKADCQPGFPCDKGGKKPQGSGCDSDSECEEGLACVENDNGKKWCFDNGTGGGGGEGGDKKPRSGGQKKFWLGLDYQLDLLFFAGDSDVCNSNNWACVQSSTGNDFGNFGPPQPSNAVAIQSGNGGNTAGGTSFNTSMRVFISADYFFSPNFSLGARLGYAFNGNSSANTPFLPFHGEIRGQYFLGEPRKTFRPYLMAGGGVAEFDAAVPNVVAAVDGTQSASAADDPVACKAHPTDIPSCLASNVTAWRLGKTGFIEAGGGFWYYLTPRVALDFGLKLVAPIPTFTLVIAPEIGIKFGL